MLEGLAGATIEYGDDIDHTAAMGEGEEVFASGTVPAAGDDCDLEIPVVAVHEPE